MDIHELQTPCLIVDLSKVRSNIRSLHRRLERFDPALRPHGKTVKNIEIINMALENKTGGIAVSTLREAEYYFGEGIRDITYAVGIVPFRLRRIAALIRRGADISVILDTAEQARALSAGAAEYGVEFPFLVELDCDGRRGGIEADDPLLVKLGRMAKDEKGIRLRGVLTHAGGSYHSDTPEGIQAVAETERETAVRAAEILRRNGMECPVVSVGSTPTAYFGDNFRGITEIRAGVFIFQDLMMAGLGVCAEEDIALSVLTSVIGRQRDKGWLITDAGWMALSNAPAGRNMKNFGAPCDIEGAPLKDHTVISTSQEHGIISALPGTAPDYDRFGIGAKLRILPNHACATAAMHDFYFTVEGGTGVTGKLSRVNGW